MNQEKSQRVCVRGQGTFRCRAAYHFHYLGPNHFLTALEPPVVLRQHTRAAIDKFRRFYLSHAALLAVYGQPMTSAYEITTPSPITGNDLL